MWLPIAGIVLAACAQNPPSVAVEVSDEESAYLMAVSGIQSRVDSGFDRVSDALSESYNTREVLFSAIRSAGYQGISESTLILARALHAPSEYEADHEAWLAHRQLATEKSAEISEAIDERDLQLMMAVFTELDQDWAGMLIDSRREFCLAVTQNPTLCHAPSDLPGGEYGIDVYEVLRLNSLANLGLFDFFGDMSPEERSIRLNQVQPQIEANLKAGGDAIKAINPPREYQEEHQALIRYFDDQYANAVAITQANQVGDDTAISEFFAASGVVFETALNEMSGEYQEIAAPWVGPDSNS